MTRERFTVTQDALGWTVTCLDHGDFSRWALTRSGAASLGREHMASEAHNPPPDPVSYFVTVERRVILDGWLAWCSCGEWRHTFGSDGDARAAWSNHANTVRHQ